MKNRTLILPSCGYDSIPSDLSVYLSVRALKAHLGPDIEIGESVSAHKLKGGPSQGTLSTTYTSLAEIPRDKARASMQDHYLSPAPGAPSPPLKLVYSLPHASPPLTGAYFVMAQVNRSTIQRTRGLLEISPPSMKSLRYGPKFTYDEFLVTKGSFASALMSFIIFSVGYCVTNFRLVSPLLPFLLLLYSNNKIAGSMGFQAICR